MTVIVAVQDDGKWVLGSDSRASDGDRYWPGIQKLHSFPVTGKASAYIGLAGHLAMHHLLRHEFRVPSNFTVGDPDAWAYRVARDLAGVARRAPEVDKTDPVTDYTGFLAYKEYCWSLDITGCSRVTAGYDAAGSGAHVALGVLYALEDIDPEDVGPGELASRAIFGAAKHVPTVDDDVQLVTT